MRSVLGNIIIVIFNYDYVITSRLSEKFGLPRVALASFPGSGNTWIRYLLDSSSGIFSGSWYGDFDINKKGMVNLDFDY